MTMQDALRFLFKWKWTLMLGTLAVTAIVTFKVLQEPVRYEARSKILIERNRTPIQIGTEQIPALGMIEVMNTEIEIVRSRPVIEAALDAIDFPPEQPRASVAERVLPLAWLERRMIELELIQPLPAREYSYERLLNALSITPVPDSNVFTISLRGANPERAIQTVNAVTDMYLRHRLEVYKAEGRSAAYEAQMNDAWNRLVDLRGKLDAFKQQNNLSVVEDTRQALLQRSEALQLQLTQMNQQLADLRRQYYDRYPAVALKREEIGTVEGQLARVRRELQQIEAQSSTVRSMEVEVEGQLNTYQLARARFEEQRAKENASIATTNILLVERPDLPTTHAALPLQMIILGAVAGFAFSFVIAIFREYFDNRVNDPALAEGILGVPVVGSVGRFKIVSRHFRHKEP